MVLLFLLVKLAGAVALLLWAVRMVRTGVERAHGPALRRALRHSRSGRIQAAAAGGAIALVLQSATATALLASGFAAAGTLSVAMGLALMLGADLGAAVAVQILSFDLDWLVPLLLIAGGGLFMKGTTRGMKQTGRICMGIALLLMALVMIGDATAPLRDSPLLTIVVSYLQGDLITAFLLGAALTWLLHSSVAFILMAATFTARDLLPLEPGIAMMLGANLGSGLIAMGLTRMAATAARQIVLGNLMFRGGGALVALGVLHLVPPLLIPAAAPAQQLVLLHLAFNALLLAVCLPFTGPGAKLAGLVVRDRVPEPDPGQQRVSALDRGAVRRPGRALANATRELLYMGQIVETMIRPVMDLYETDDQTRRKQVRRLDDIVNQCHSEIKLYLAELDRASMSAAQSGQVADLSSFAINLEHAGDVVVKTLLRLAAEKNSQRLVFSPEGWRDLTGFHDRVLDNMQLAMNVLLSGDRESARHLIAEKDRMGQLERENVTRHLRRLQGGGARSVETSDLHLETLRALRQINSLFASVAYPILSESGDLLASRLATSDI